jgi:lysophospholipase L1-like esterase
MKLKFIYLYIMRYTKRIRFLVIYSVIISLVSFTHPPVTWVAIGDSITYLNDHPEETKNRLSKGWLTDIAEKLSYIHYINQGHNGWTTTNFAQSWDKLRIPAGDVYTVFLGTNDWWQSHRIGTWDDYAQNTGDSTINGCFRIIVDKLHALNHSAPIILITPMPRADFVYIDNPNNNAWGSYKAKNGQTLEQVADAVIEIGKHEQLKVVDLYHEKKLAVPHLVHFKRLKDPQTGEYHNYPWPEYTTIPSNPSQSEYPYPKDAIDMTYDGLHPSDKGCTLIAKKVMKALKKVI